MAFALKKQAGVSVLNLGCLYQHAPRKYRQLHAKGVDWVTWPLSATPASFHKFKDADELRAFFGCALYDARGQPRPAPQALFAPLNGSSSGAPLPDEGAVGAAPAMLPCADGWSAPPDPPHGLQRSQVLDSGVVSI